MSPAKGFRMCGIEARGRWLSHVVPRWVKIYVAGSEGASRWEEKACLDCRITKNQPEMGLERAGRIIHHSPIAAPRLLPETLRYGKRVDIPLQMSHRNRQESFIDINQWYTAFARAINLPGRKEEFTRSSPKSSADCCWTFGVYLTLNS